MDGLRPTLLTFLGERGNAASNLKRQHQADRKARRLRRRECSPGGASGFGSSHSSTFALADSDLEGRRPPNRPIIAPDRHSGPRTRPRPRPLPCPCGISSSWMDRPCARCTGEILSYRATLGAATIDPSGRAVQLPCPAVVIGAGDAMSNTRITPRIRPMSIKQCLCFRAFDWSAIPYLTGNGRCATFYDQVNNRLRLRFPLRGPSVFSLDRDAFAPL